MSEFKDKWLAALRSGKFVQTQESLQDEKGYCCLGVGAVIAGEEFYVSEQETFRLRSTEETAFYWGPNNELRMLVVPPVKGFKPNTIADILAQLNDDLEWTFDQIADWLETIDF